MNQIICTSSTNIVIPNDNSKKKKIFRILFYIFLFISSFLSIYYIILKYNIYKTEKLSRNLIKDYNLTAMYNTNVDYTANFVNKEIIQDKYENVSNHIIGIIEIKKINIVYPILSEINKNFLKVSTCRFYGPTPNEIGNLCIAAHNYKNGTFFSNLSNLVIGDIITIYDTKGKSLDYIIYDVYKTSAKDTECINQNTHNKKIITLVTCDSIDNNYRTVVKAKEI